MLYKPRNVIVQGQNLIGGKVAFRNAVVARFRFADLGVMTFVGFNALIKAFLHNQIWHPANTLLIGVCAFHCGTSRVP